MKAKTLYTCEYCHTDYADKKDALECEKVHKGKFEIKENRFLPYKMDNSGWPVKIVAKNEAGETKMYKR